MVGMTTISGSASSAREAARRSDGRFGAQAKGDPGQGVLARWDTPPLGDTDRILELAGGRDVADLSAAEVVAAAEQPDPQIVRQVADRLPGLPDDDADALSRGLSRARLMTGWMSEGGGEAAWQAADHDDVHGTDLLRVDRDEFATNDGGYDWDQMARASEDAWREDAARLWESAQTRADTAA